MSGWPGGKILAAEISGPMPFLCREGRRLQLLRLRGRSPGIVDAIHGMTLNRRDDVQALAYRDKMVRAFDDLLRPFDAWLCPVTRTPAFSRAKSTGSNIVPAADGRPALRRLPQWIRQACASPAS
jgi:hypothetical protein